MKVALDPRIVELGIEINGVLQVYNTLKINAVGVKFANANQNECEVRISNLDKETRDYILTQTSPFNNNRTPKTLILYAGRQSYGAAQIYTGTISSVRVSQPPDVTIALKCLTGNYAKGIVLSRSGTASSSLSDLARQIAQDLNVNLNFQANDKQISNYSFTGSTLRQVDVLGELSDVDAYIDDNSLIVKQSSLPLESVTKVINLDTGMIGIPDITERGLNVTYLLDNTSRVGGMLSVTSVMYPIVNGNYIIYKLGFDISNRDTPFYYIAEAKRIV